MEKKIILCKNYDDITWFDGNYFRRTSTCRRCERETTGEKCATSLACRAFFMRRHDGFTAPTVPRGAYCIVRDGAHSASGAHHRWRKLTVPDIRIWRLWIGFCLTEKSALSNLLSCTHKNQMLMRKRTSFREFQVKSPFHLDL